MICFQGVFTPGTTDDCLFGPPSDSESAGFQIYPRIPVLETIVSSNVPSIQSQMDCFFTVSFQYHGANVSPPDPVWVSRFWYNLLKTEGSGSVLFPLQSTLAVIKFGSLSVLYVYVPAQGAVVSSDQMNSLFIINESSNVLKNQDPD